MNTGIFKHYSAHAGIALARHSYKSSAQYSELRSTVQLYPSDLWANAQTALGLPNILH